MSQENSSTDVRRSQPITRREDARELTKKLSTLDLDIYDRVIEKAKLLPQETEEDCLNYEMVMDAINEDAGLGSKQLLGIVRWLNDKFPENPILIPSDYGISPAEVELPDWLIPGLVLRNGLTLFYGDAGSYKTTLAIYMGYALMTGADFFGIPLDDRYKVLYVEQDESINVLKDQLQMIGYPEDIFICCKLPVLWNGKEFNRDFHNTLEALEPDVVFIDALTTLGIDDITRPPAALCLDALRRIANDKNLSIVLLHHENLQGKPLGLRLIIGKIDSELQTSVSPGVENTDKIILAQGKVRGEHLEPIFFKASRGTLRIEREFNMNISQMVRGMSSQGLDKQAILSHFRGTREKAAARKALQRLGQRTQPGT